MMDWIYEPWPWYVAGPGITAVMLLLIFNGKAFGVSSNLRTMCSIAGAGKVTEFFSFDWKSQTWNLVFIFGGLLGGLIAKVFMSDDAAVLISESTQVAVQNLGITVDNGSLVPMQLFNLGGESGLAQWLFLLVGGLFIGFGTRYAGGCTSGHAISGLSNLQLPSLIAVIGFFAGGLLMTHFILPYLIPIIL